MWYTQNDFHPIKNAADNQICQSHSVDEVANAKRGKSARLPSVFPPDWLSKSPEVFWPIKVLTEKKAIAELVLVLIESALFSTVTNSANATTTPVRFFETTTQALFSSYMLGAKSSTSAVQGGVVRPRRNQIYNQINFPLETAQLLFQTREILAAFLSKLSQMRVKFSYLLILFFQSALPVLYVLIAVVSVSSYCFVVISIKLERGQTFPTRPWLINIHSRDLVTCRVIDFFFGITIFQIVRIFILQRIRLFPTSPRFRHEFFAKKEKLLKLRTNERRKS